MTNKGYLKRQKAACLRKNGWTIKAIAKALGVSIGRVREYLADCQCEPEPDEIVFESGLKLETPIMNLPVERDLRDALKELGLVIWDDLVASEWNQLAGSLCRFPKIGRIRLARLEAILTGWRQR